MENLVKEQDPAISAAEYFSNLRGQDQEAYNRWRASGSKKDMGLLIDQLGKVIYHEVKRASGTLPTSALAAEAKNWTIKAIKSYDPDKGTLISTHVMNYLPKIRRMNYKFQNSARLPEHMQLKYHDYNHALTGLSEELNREPTDAELAARLGWTKGQTVKYKNSLYADLIESGSEQPGEFTQFNHEAILMDHLRSQLTKDELFIFDNINTKTMNATAIANHLGVNINRYNYLKTKLIEKIKDIQAKSGM